MPASCLPHALHSGDGRDPVPFWLRTQLWGPQTFRLELSSSSAGACPPSPFSPMVLTYRLSPQCPGGLGGHISAAWNASPSLLFLSSTRPPPALLLQSTGPAPVERALSSPHRAAAAPQGSESPCFPLSLCRPHTHTVTAICTHAWAIHWAHFSIQPLTGAQAAGSRWVPMRRVGRVPLEWRCLDDTHPSWKRVAVSLDLHGVEAAGDGCEGKVGPTQRDSACSDEELELSPGYWGTGILLKRV